MVILYQGWQLVVETATHPPSGQWSASITLSQPSTGMVPNQTLRIEPHGIHSSEQSAFFGALEEGLEHIDRLTSDAHAHSRSRPERLDRGHEPHRDPFQERHTASL
jgi:hypothetical protein